MNNAYIGIIITLLAFGIGKYLFKKSKGFFLFTPLFVGMVLGILILKIGNISYKEYAVGGDMVKFLLEPATICFAIPLYKKKDVLKKYWKQIIGGISLGTMGAILGIYYVAKAFKMGSEIIASMLPQAATTAIAIPVSESMGGIGGLTSLTVILNAVIIYALGKKLLDVFNITNPIARGLALGTSGHALGVSVGAELGEVEASMASIALVVVGVIVVAVVPIAARILL